MSHPLHSSQKQKVGYIVQHTCVFRWYNPKFYLVPHVGVGGEHVHLHAQGRLVGGELAVFHVLEQPQRLLNGSA